MGNLLLIALLAGCPLFPEDRAQESTQLISRSISNKIHIDARPHIFTGNIQLSSKGIQFFKKISLGRDGKHGIETTNGN